MSSNSEDESSDGAARDELYRRQVKLLQTFLENGAITKAQFDKSYGDLTRKMYPEESTH